MRRLVRFPLCVCKSIYPGQVEHYGLYIRTHAYNRSYIEEVSVFT